ncbi:hypothetical protein JTE90_023935 [Oedothorax gibbosus]|uniref:RNA polymerase II-associated protein 1 n=1 Tax=Oedothorax gibbosus TaxID=931172 RepID=A0AAV6UTN2_9ARAC|nr:hypothetical protein JTE90_023935 [Oedothorax gibbosus]
MEDIQRPTTQETDEDLLHQQELFFKNKCKTNSNVKIKDTEAISLEESNTNTVEEDKTKKELDNEIQSFCFEVKEKTSSDLKNFCFEPLSSETVEILNMKSKKLHPSQFSLKNKKKSLFAQLMEKIEDEVIPTEILPDAVCKSSLIDGSGLNNREQERELKKIHEENLSKLASMSKEEILKHQLELKSQLDPTLIQFIKSRRNFKKSSKSKEPVSESVHAEDSDCPGEILRKEGRTDCDALILEKANEFEVDRRNKLLTDLKGKNIEIPSDTKELLEEVDKGNWVNMKNIEKEKLEWISDLPKKNPVDLKTGFTARFDFEGLLLAHDVETPTFKGLHHHGEEPEVAGYSLEELFLLARSTLQSQRITALHTIAHILDNYWNGMFDGCFDEPLLPTMLEAGLVPLLRWALDDTSLTSLAATITAMHSLLISKIDEMCLHRTFCWLHGHILPLLKPENLIDSNVVPEELTDADLIKLDVVKAFLQMDILPRFSYVLKVLQPSPLVCKLIIEICAHIAQHSIDSAEQVVKLPGFLDFIIEKFLPLKFQFIDSSKLTDSVGYKYPLSSAMKLIRIIYSSQTDLVLTDSFNIVQHILCYLVLDPSEWQSDADNLHHLMIESLKTTHVLLCCSIKYSTFLPIFPVFLRQMEFIKWKLDLSSERSKHFKDFEYATHLFKVLEALTIASTYQNDPNSSNLQGIVFDKALECLKKWLFQFSQGHVSDHGMMLVSGCMNFVSTYYKEIYIPCISEALKHCPETTDLFQNYLFSCIESEGFKDLLLSIGSSSLLLHSGKSGNYRDSKTIVSLGSILWKDDIIPTIKKKSPIPFLLAVIKLSALQKDLIPLSDNIMLQKVLHNISIRKYLRRISSENLNADSWFARYETYFLSQVLLLPSTEGLQDTSLWYNVASSLLPILRAPDESIAKDLFENIIFNRNYFLSTKKEHLEDEATKELIGKLPVIFSRYSVCLLKDEAISHSRKILSSVRCRSLVSPSKSEFLLPKDWFYTPIWKKYKNSKERTCDNKLTTGDEMELLSCLEWILISHKFALPFVKNIPVSVEFCYLCMLFLLDDNFFRKSEINKLVEECISSILTHKEIRLTEFKWSTLNSFDDLYMEMLNQFEDISYGDELFGNFIVFPLQQCYPSDWRKLFLTEHSQVLHFLRVPLSKLFVPLKCYLEPYEQKFSLISKYYSLLASGSLTLVRCPLIYLMAVHHVHHYIFSEEVESKYQQKTLITSILDSKQKVVRQHILLYSEVKLDEDCGFTMKAELSSNNKIYLQSVVGRSLNLDL